MADIFGLAFADYLDGARNGIIEVHTDISEAEELPVAYFFRAYNNMPEWEKMVLDACKGPVLDVGAGAGSHSLELQSRGLDVTAIDLSAGAVKTMLDRGVSNALCQDFFTFAQGEFRSILLLMNGAGMAGSLSGLGNLLIHARKLLAADGTIYLESSDLLYLFEEEDGSALIPFGDKYYGEIQYQLVYKKTRGFPFPWLFVDSDNLEAIAHGAGLKTRILFRSENHNYMAALTAL